jgi:dihydroorotate dehydrogenase
LLFNKAHRLLHAFDPERAHRIAVRALAVRQLLPAPKNVDPPILKTRVWGREFSNPIGMAAGFDKQAEVPNALLKIGFGFVETGTVTPLPQSGNPKPRVFRLVEDHAVINRMGFNSDGLEVIASRIRRHRFQKTGIIGANIGKNRDTQDAIKDYVIGVRTLAPIVDYLVVNVSSPNTPGLRDLQRGNTLKKLLKELLNERAAVTKENPPALLLKIAPDLNAGQCDDIADAVLELNIDGLVVSNTTTERPTMLRSTFKFRSGGLSGRPLFEPSTKLLGNMYRLTEGKIPIIGVGGISSGVDAYEKICAGASLIQLLTAFIFDGPEIIKSIKSDLVKLLERDHFKSVAEAVGSAVNISSTRRAVM